MHDPLHDIPPHRTTSATRSLRAQRQWLLARHGPTCAYCGQRTHHTTITLDHVRPRRGQTAYDRPDNLVLACRACNAAKADRPLSSWLLADRTRAQHLLRYGAHLTAPLLAEASAATATATPPGVGRHRTPRRDRRGARRA